MGTPFLSISCAFKTIYRERGSQIRQIYKGVEINGARAFVSWGIINVSYEAIKRLF